MSIPILLSNVCPASVLLRPIRSPPLVSKIIADNICATVLVTLGCYTITGCISTPSMER